MYTNILLSARHKAITDEKLKNEQGEHNEH